MSRYARHRRFSSSSIQLVINSKAARNLDLTIPLSLALRADEVIE